MKPTFLMTTLPLSLTFGSISAWAWGDRTVYPVQLSWHDVRSAISSLYSAVASLFQNSVASQEESGDVN
jgi:hypothetical protein